MYFEKENTHYDGHTKACNIDYKFEDHSLFDSVGRPNEYQQDDCRIVCYSDFDRWLSPDLSKLKSKPYYWGCEHVEYNMTSFKSLFENKDVCEIIDKLESLYVDKLRYFSRGIVNVMYKLPVTTRKLLTLTNDEIFAQKYRYFYGLKFRTNSFYKISNDILTKMQPLWEYNGTHFRHFLSMHNITAENFIYESKFIKMPPIEHAIISDLRISNQSIYDVVYDQTYKRMRGTRKSNLRTHAGHYDGTYRINDISPEHDIEITCQFGMQNMTHIGILGAGYKTFKFPDTDSDIKFVRDSIYDRVWTKSFDLYCKLNVDNGNKLVFLRSFVGNTNNVTEVLHDIRGCIDMRKIKSLVIRPKPNINHNHRYTFELKLYGLEFPESSVSKNVETICYNIKFPKKPRTNKERWNINGGGCDKRRWPINPQKCKQRSFNYAIRDGINDYNNGNY